MPEYVIRTEGLTRDFDSACGVVDAALILAAKARFRRVRLVLD